MRTRVLSFTCGIGIARGDDSSTAPRAAQLVVTGACSNSATRCTWSNAPAWITPLPTWMTGSSHCVRSAAARATSPASGAVGATRRYCDGARYATSPGISPFIRFSGTSRCTTPGRPSQQARSAPRISSGMRSKPGTARLCFANAPTTAAWSKPW